MNDILVPQQQVKRGRPRKAVQKDIDFDDTVDIKPRLLYDISKYDCRPITIPEMLPNVIDSFGVVLDKSTNTPILQLPSNATSLMIRNWKLGKGGVFLRDVKRFYKGSDASPEYMCLVSDEQNALIRIVSAEEEPVFNECGIIDGSYDETRKYVLIKLLEFKDSTTSFFSSLDERTNRDIIDYKTMEEESANDEDSLYKNVITESDEYDEDDMNDNEE